MQPSKLSINSLFIPSYIFFLNFDTRYMGEWCYQLAPELYRDEGRYPHTKLNRGLMIEIEQ